MRMHGGRGSHCLHALHSPAYRPPSLACWRATAAICRPLPTLCRGAGHAQGGGLAKAMKYTAAGVGRVLKRQRLTPSPIHTPPPLVVLPRVQCSGCNSPCAVACTTGPIGNQLRGGGRQTPSREPNRHRRQARPARHTAPCLYQAGRHTWAAGTAEYSVQEGLTQEEAGPRAVGQAWPMEFEASEGQAGGQAGSSACERVRWDAAWRSGPCCHATAMQWPKRAARRLQQRALTCKSRALSPTHLA